MKLPPKTPTPMTFEQLVQHAKTSDVGVGPADVERMLQRLQTRIRLEGIPQPTPGQPSMQGPAGPTGHEPRVTGHDKLVKTGLGKGLLGGLGLLAAAALYYNAETPASEPPAGTPPVVVAAPARGLAAPTPQVSPDLRDEATALADDQSVVTTEAPVVGNTPITRAAAKRRAPSRSPNAHGPTVTSEPGLTNTSITDAKPAPTPSAERPAATSAAPSLDASLEQLERAERALRSGNPSAALTALSTPVVPTLSSRADALRAVALCQSGNTAAGTKIAQRHLARNPASPYEKRLQAACGKDL